MAVARELSAIVTLTNVTGPALEMPPPWVAELKAIVLLVSESEPVDSWSMPPPDVAELFASDEFEIVTCAAVVDAAA